MPSIKIYVISLKNSDKRRKFMADQLNNLNLNFEFIDAIDGSKLSNEELKDLYADGQYFRPLKRGEIACSLSHRKACEVMVRNNDAHALIMEDDIFISKKFPFILDKIEKELDEETAFSFFNILLYECNYQVEKELIPEYFLTTPSNVRAVFGNQAYLVSQKTARELIKLVVPIRNCPDDWLWFKESGTFKNLKVIFPFPVLHAEFLSDIHVESLNLSNSFYSKVKGIIFKYKIPILYHLVMYKRRKEAENLRKSRARLNGKQVSSTVKL